MSLLGGELKTYKDVLIVGDWNSDPQRLNPVDCLFNKFIKSNYLSNASNYLINKNE